MAFDLSTPAGRLAALEAEAPVATGVVGALVVGFMMLRDTLLELAGDDAGGVDVPASEA